MILRILRRRPEAELYLKERSRQKERLAAAAAAEHPTSPPQPPQRPAIHLNFALRSSASDASATPTPGAGDAAAAHTTAQQSATADGAVAPPVVSQAPLVPTVAALPPGAVFLHELRHS